MKIEFEGTLEEVVEDVERLNYLLNASWKEDEEAEEYDNLSYNLLKIKNMDHYSETKGETLAISEMHPEHILNVMRIMLQQNRSSNLLEYNELKSMVLNLADMIVKDYKGEF